MVENNEQELQPVVVEEKTLYEKFRDKVRELDEWAGASEELKVRSEYLGDAGKIGVTRGQTMFFDLLPFDMGEEQANQYRAELAELEKNQVEFYNQNKDTLYGVPYVAAMLGEELSNPITGAVNLLTASMTGGLSLGGQLAVGGVVDAGYKIMETESVYGRQATPGEIGASVAAGAIMPIIGEYVGKRTRFNSNFEAGNSEFNARKLINHLEDISGRPGSTELMLQQSYGTPIYRPVDPNIPNSPLRQISADAINPDKVDASTIIDNATYLQKRKATYDLNPDKSSIGGNVEFVDSHKTFDIVSKAVKDNIDEFKAYSWSHTEGRTDVDLANIRDTYYSYYKDYQNQQLVIGEQYSGILKMTPQEYLNKVGHSNKNLTEMYIRGNTDILADTNEKAFWDNVMTDRDILQGSETVFSIDDVENANDLITRWAGALDENGKLDAEIYTKYAAMGENNPMNIKEGDGDIVARLNGAAVLPEGFDRAFVSRIEFGSNKKAILADGYGYFEQSFKKFHKKDSIGNKLKEGMEEAFNEEFGPLFENGIFPNNIIDTQKRVDYVYNLYNTLQRSIDTNRGNSSYVPFQELTGFFEDQEAMFRFFNRNDGMYMKTNNELITSIYEDQTSQISMLDTFGTSNPARMRNRASKLDNAESITKATGIEVPSDSDKRAAMQARAELDAMLNNTFFKQHKSEIQPAMKWFDGVHGIVSRGFMYMRGLNEFVTNAGIASMNSIRYGDNPVSGLSFGTLRAMKRMAKSSMGQEFPHSNYSAAQMAKNQKIIDPSSLMDRVDDFGYGFNSAADVNFNTLGDAFATNYIHKLKPGMSIDSLDNELRRVFKINGIDTQEQLDKFITFSKNHIDANGDYINKAELIEQSGDEMADSLRGIYNFLSSKIGEQRSDTIFQSKSGNVFEKILGTFRGFTRALTSKMLDTTMRYTTREGIRKSRFSWSSQGNFLDKIKSVDASGLKEAIRGKNVVNVATVAGIAYGVGKGGKAIKDLGYGSRDFTERWSLMKQRLFGNFQTDLNNEGFLTALWNDFWPNIAEGTGLDIPGIFSADSPYVSIYNQGKKGYNNVMADKVVEFDEVSMEALDLIFSVFISKEIRNLAKATNDTAGRNWDDSDRVYGFTKQQNQAYYMEVFKNRMTYNDVMDSVGLIDKMSTHANAMADYIEDKKDSFDKLTDNAKQYFNIVSDMSGKTKIEKEAAKSGFAVIWSESQLESDSRDKKEVLNNGIKEEFGVSVNEVDKYVEQTNKSFNDLSDKRKLYYQTLMEYNQTPDTMENRIKFTNTIGSANASDAGELLKRYYNVDINEFNNYGRQTVELNKPGKPSVPVMPDVKKSRKESVVFTNEEGTPLDNEVDVVAGATESFRNDEDVRKAMNILPPKERFKAKNIEEVIAKLESVPDITYVEEDLSKDTVDAWYSGGKYEIGIDLKKHTVDKLSYLVQHELQHHEQNIQRRDALGSMSLNNDRLYRYITSMEELDSVFAGFNDDPAAVKAYITNYQGMGQLFKDYPMDVLANVVVEYRNIREGDRNLMSAHSKMKDIIKKANKK